MEKTSVSFGVLAAGACFLGKKAAAGLLIVSWCGHTQAQPKKPKKALICMLGCGEKFCLSSRLQRLAFSAFFGSALWRGFGALRFVGAGFVAFVAVVPFGRGVSAVLALGVVVPDGVALGGRGVRFGCAGGGFSSFRAWSSPSFCLGVFLVLFVRFVVRFARRGLGWCWLAVCVGCALCAWLGWVAVGWALLGAGALVSVLCAAVWLVSRVVWVRFPRPALPLSLRRFAFGLAGSSLLLGWRCVPAGALPAVRARCWVWVVRPAVVSRRSGVVSFFWVWAVLPSAGRQSRPAG